MKKSMKTILTAILVIVLTLGMATAAFAAGGQVAGQGGGTITSDTGSTDYTIEFVAGDTYELTAAEGTFTAKNGNVIVNTPNRKIPEKLIPQVDGADKYYAVKGWAIMGSNGELENIDLKNYVFTSYNTKVYAIVEDIWVPYIDMKQDRSDWFYRYVRDLSIAKVVAGYPDNTFRQGADVTWGQALKLIMLATGYAEQAPINAHWASGYLDKAIDDKLVTKEQNIDLNAPVTRLEYAQVAAKAMKLPAANIATPFVDTDDAAVLSLYEAGIMEGSFNINDERVYMPQSNITRAELSTVIWRINNYYSSNAAE